MTFAATPLEDLRTWLAVPAATRPALSTQAFAAVPLTREQADAAATLLWDDYAATARAERKTEWDRGEITVGPFTLKLKRRTIGNQPPGGRSLFISMHGGGNAPAAVNDQQWANQIRLYDSPDSLYVAPRAPTNSWMLWHEPHIDGLFDRLIADAIVFADVNPDKVYLMGYSAGGDGVYQLGPRMADRFAAAAMMAGHPNDASPLGLRNLPFAIHVGALDTGFDRNKKAAEWDEKLGALRKADPAGYAHVVELHAGRGHWMNREDASAVPWMAAKTRDPFPARVVWEQGHAPHTRFYWLAVPEKETAFGRLIVARRDGQTITIERHSAAQPVTIRLNDAMVDLDRPVRVVADGKTLFDGVAPRTVLDLNSTLVERGDPRSVFSASVTVTLSMTTTQPLP